MAKARVYMQFVATCPRCSRRQRFEQSLIGGTPGDVFHEAFVKRVSQGPGEPVEVPVTCDDCGHEFVVDTFTI